MGSNASLSAHTSPGSEPSSFPVSATALLTEALSVAEELEDEAGGGRLNNSAIMRVRYPACVGNKVASPVPADAPPPPKACACALRRANDMIVLVAVFGYLGKTTKAQRYKQSGRGDPLESGKASNLGDHYHLHTLNRVLSQRLNRSW